MKTLEEFKNEFKSALENKKEWLLINVYYEASQEICTYKFHIQWQRENITDIYNNFIKENTHVFNYFFID